MAERYPDTLETSSKQAQPRWKWYAISCSLKDEKPCALLIEAGSGFLLVVEVIAEDGFSFGLDFIDAFQNYIGIHPVNDKDPHESVYSLEQNPEAIRWERGTASQPALKKRLQEAKTMLADLSLGEGIDALRMLNSKKIVLGQGSLVPEEWIDGRLQLYAAMWQSYAEEANVLRFLWNVWRKNKPWLADLKTE